MRRGGSRWKMTRWFLGAAFVSGFLALAGCGEEVKPNPQEITANTSCALDGMLLLDYPGPKAQIHYDQGPPDFFCDTVEMFAVYLEPEQKKRVVAIYTQDMGKADWTKPQGHWFDAKIGFYVTGSKRTGSMGPTLGAFARKEDAQTFVKQYGGQVLRFDQVTPETVVLDGGVLHDERM